MHSNGLVFNHHLVHRHVERLNRYTFYQLEVKPNAHLVGVGGAFKQAVVEPSATAHAVPVAVEGYAGNNDEVYLVKVGEHGAGRLSYAKLLTCCHALRPGILPQQQVVAVYAGE